MFRSENLIPARFLTILSHLCVTSTLLWESQQTVRYCLPSQYHSEYLLIYHSRLVAGFATSITLTLVEMITFLSGLTMFHPNLSLLYFTNIWAWADSERLYFQLLAQAIACHGSGTISLSYFVLGGWLCDWFWWIFTTCDVLPCTLNAAVATALLCTRR